MLVNVVVNVCTTTDQLQHAVERHEYGEAAQLLEAVQQLFAHFQSYGNVPKVWCDMRITYIALHTVSCITLRAFCP